MPYALFEEKKGLVMKTNRLFFLLLIPALLGVEQQACAMLSSSQLPQTVAQATRRAWKTALTAIAMELADTSRDEIRLYNPNSDAESVARIAALNIDSFAGVPLKRLGPGYISRIDTHFETTDERVCNYILPDLNHRNSTSFVYVRNGQTVGFISCKTYWKLLDQTLRSFPPDLKYISGPEAVIKYFAVDPDHSSTGVGRRLLQHLLEHCENEPFDCISLSTKIKSLAPYFKSFGFEDISSSRKLACSDKPIFTFSKRLGTQPAFQNPKDAIKWLVKRLTR
jgi:ribosomal protein S18 acetylase RimI-like enzyme